jgi:phosphosulfolactate synthase
MEFLSLPQRTSKPRQYGITSLHDIGIPLGELENLLADYHGFIDIAKLGIGTAYITPRLREKIALYKNYGVAVHFGGTLFEKFHHCSSIEQYKRYMRSLDIHWCEISTGILDIPLQERIAIVEDLSREFTVLAEVGTKDAQQSMPSHQWIKEIQAFLNAGCRYIVTEGRSTGTAGIYHSNGDIRSELIWDILDKVDSRKIVFEAPNPKMQAFFTNLIGANANLGNIPPRDILFVEAQRNGLWNETFFMSEMKAPGMNEDCRLADPMPQVSANHATA